MGEGLNEMIAASARRGAELGVIPGVKMCNDCAFKLGTAANSEEHTVADAADCLAFDGKFNCHTGGLQDAGHPCAGFLYAKQYLATLENL